MKKIVFAVLIAIVLFIVLIYISVSTTSTEFGTCEILNLGDIEQTDFSKHDSVLVATSTLYQGNFLKDVIQGKNYREAWSTPVKIPIVFLDTLKGGVKVVDEGGGKQTHSLDLEAKNGIIYTMRSINKDPQPLIPDFAYAVGIENIVVDGISAQHPYAALVVAQLAETIDVLHTNPKAIFVPKQKGLGEYNEKYGNRLFLLEYESEGKVNWTSIPDVIEIIDSDNLQKLKAKDKNVFIDKGALVRARLFDLIIGDWDRHAKQWGWAIKTVDSSTIAYPIPADRDNAFFDVDGILPHLIANQVVKPDLRPFDDEISFMPGLVKTFDRYFLQNVSEELFVEEAQHIQRLLTDDKIKQAFTVWSTELYDLNGQEIMTKIKARRNDLIKYAKAFYNEIGNQGVLTESIVGSEDLDLPEHLIKCFDCK